MSGATSRQAKDDRTTSNPALSVVMPAYNAQPYIGRAIESILNQTFGNLELIIIDDQSTDATWNLVQEYAERDPRVRIFRNRENLGPAATTNRAVMMARSGLIAGMDADDIALPIRLEKQVAVMTERSDIAVLGCYVSHTNDQDQILSLQRMGAPSVAAFEKLRQNDEPTVVLGGTVMYRRKLFDRVGGFDGTLRTAADLEFCDRMADHGAIIAIPEPLQLYRIYSTSNVMMRFWEGRQTHRYVKFRRAAFHRGEPSPTREQYVEIEQTASWWRRLRIRQDDVSQYFYRLAGLAYAEGRIVKTARRLVVAGVVGPTFVIRRIWDQRLSPQARTTRGA